MKKTALIFIALFLLPLFAVRTDACDCAQITVCEGYQRASIIFVGTVSSNAPAKVKVAERTSGNNEIETYSERVFSFTVEQSFKGSENGEIEIQTGMGGGDCGYSFNQGERYLVYGNFDPRTKLYRTSICSRTRLFAGASEDLDFLRGLPESLVKPRISGTITQELNDLDKSGYPKHQRMSGVKVVLHSEKTFETVTNDDGVYLFVGLPPGQYKLKADLPAPLSIKERDIKLPAVGCATVDIYTKTDGRIAGRIVDNLGQVVGGAKIKLIPADVAKDASKPSIVLRSHSEYTDKEGGFEFKEVTPGKYYLGINLNEEPKGDSPYPRTYYPGTPDQDKATVIVLSEGEKLVGYDLVLAPALSVKTLEGIFVWSDGRPVNPGTVSCTDSTDKGGRVYGAGHVNAQGQFRFDSLTGKECWIHGSTYSTVNGTMEFVDIEPVKILVTDGMMPIKLIAPVPNRKQK